MKNGNIHKHDEILAEHDIPGNILMHKWQALCVRKVGY